MKAGQTWRTGIRTTPDHRRKWRGFVRFVDLVDGVTVIEKTDEPDHWPAREITDPKRRGTQKRDLRPLVRIVDIQQGRTSIRNRPAGAVPAAAALDRQPAGRARRSAWATWSPRSRRKRRRPATSPAVCRAWRGTVRGRKPNPAILAERLAASSASARRPGQAAPDHHGHRRQASTRADPEVSPDHRVRRRARRERARPSWTASRPAGHPAPEGRRGRWPTTWCAKSRTSTACRA